MWFLIHAKIASHPDITVQLKTAAQTKVKNATTWLLTKKLKITIKYFFENIFTVISV